MPWIDIVVLLGILAATPVASRSLWRRGARGWRLAGLSWVAFFGVVLTIMMSAHTVDILFRLYLGKGHDGAPWSYDFRIYGLLLLGALLIACGVGLLRAAAALAKGDTAGRARALQTVAVVLAVVVPLLPIHTFFAALITTLGVLSLAVLLGGRAWAPAPRLAEIALRPPARARVGIGA